MNYQLGSMKGIGVWRKEGLVKEGKPQKTNGASLGFENQLWAAADKMRGHIDASKYKGVVLGLIFLKYISDSFQTKYTALQAEKHADPEDRDEYMADNIFWGPVQARWVNIQNNAKQATIGQVNSFEASPIGPIPKGWQAKSLFDTATFVNGSSFRSAYFCEPSEGLPIIKIAELKNGISNQTNYTTQTLDDKYSVDTGDMFYSWSGSPDTSFRCISLDRWSRLA